MCVCVWVYLCLWLSVLLCVSRKTETKRLFVWMRVEEEVKAVYNVHASQVKDLCVWKSFTIWSQDNNMNLKSIKQEFYFLQKTIAPNPPTPTAVYRWLFILLAICLTGHSAGLSAARINSPRWGNQISLWHRFTCSPTSAYTTCQRISVN